MLHFLRLRLLPAVKTAYSSASPCRTEKPLGSEIDKIITQISPFVNPYIVMPLMQSLNESPRNCAAFLHMSMRERKISK